jgi:hypothetical protein
MSSLKDLQIDESIVDVFTTPYVKVSNYKCLRIISNFSNAGYLYIYHSVDSKTDSLTNTFLCNNKPSLHKVEVISDYIRICITTMNPNELIDKVSVSVKGRRSVNSNLFNLLSNFQPPQNNPEINNNYLEPPKLGGGNLEISKEEEKKGTSGIYRRLGIHTKQKESQKPSNCRCNIIPELLLQGHLLYVKSNGRFEVLPPPVADGKSYLLTMCNKQPYWIASSELQDNSQGWFKP